jgi:hypothetical protein
MWTSVSPCHDASNNEVRRDTLQTRDVGFKQSSDKLTSLKKLTRLVAAGQGLTLVRFSAHRKHFLWDTLGAFSSYGS